jgi:hypothetical protein
MENELVLHGPGCEIPSVPFDIPHEQGHYRSSWNKNLSYNEYTVWVQKPRARIVFYPSSMMGFYTVLGWKTVDLVPF